MKDLCKLGGLAASLALTGCSNLPPNMPLVFAENITFGISAATSTVEQGANITLGFKSQDVALVPVVSLDGATKDGFGKPVPIEGTTTAQGGTVNKDAYSVLGQFNASTDEAGKRIGLGKFFATGQAALHLSSGFEKCLASGGCAGQAAQAPTTPSKP